MSTVIKEGIDWFLCQLTHEINNYFMDIAHIREYLASTNLNPQPSTYKKVASFLKNEMGIGNQASVYQVLAAFAILSQVQKIKAVDNSEEVSTGIHLQTVMKHLGKYSKETLLQEVIRQSEKWREAPLQLKAKIDQVNIAYRIYKKYRTLFQDLSQKYTQIDEQCQINLMSIFWVVYLFIKNTTHRDPNTLDSTKLLGYLFRFLFCQLIAQMEQHLLLQAFEKHFTNNQILQSNTYQSYKTKILQKLREIHHQERGVDNFNLQNMVKHQHIMMRFLDDIDNNYSKFKNRLTVDQLSFNQLQKVLTPLPLMHQCYEQGQAISQKLKFDQDSDKESDSDHSQSEENDDRDKPSEMQAQLTKKEWQCKKKLGNGEGHQNKNQQNMNRPLVRHTIKPISPIRLSNKSVQFQFGTPISIRNENLSWINKIAQVSQQENTAQIKSIFEKYTCLDYATFQAQILDKISKSIDHFTSSCKDKLKRKQCIYSLFVYLVICFYNEYQQERQIIFSKKSHFSSILCLANNLFNYANQSLQSSHFSYCQVYEIDIISSLIPFNLFTANKQMPKNIELYLYEVQRKISIQQIWQSDEGYKWLIQGCTGHYGQNIFQRVKMHIDYRTQQLCQAMKIQNKQSQKVINLMRFILQKRHLFLRNHNMDQIIVCAITSIISINRYKNISLEETFENYNKLLYSLSTNNTIFYDNTGQRIDILTYYKDIFLPQIEEIIKDQSAQNILSTPVRLEMSKHQKESVPLSLTLKQFSSIGFGKNKGKTDNQYRHKIIQNLKNLDLTEIDKNNAQQMTQSSGSIELNRSMRRTFSFSSLDKF